MVEVASDFRSRARLACFYHTHGAAMKDYLIVFSRTSPESRGRFFSIKRVNVRNRIPSEFPQSIDSARIPHTCTQQAAISYLETNHEQQSGKSSKHGGLKDRVTSRLRIALILQIFKRKQRKFVLVLDRRYGTCYLRRVSCSVAQPGRRMYP